MDVIVDVMASLTHQRSAVSCWPLGISGCLFLHWLGCGAFSGGFPGRFEGSTTSHCLGLPGDQPAESLHDHVLGIFLHGSLENPAWHSLWDWSTTSNVHDCRDYAQWLAAFHVHHLLEFHCGGGNLCGCWDGHLHAGAQGRLVEAGAIVTSQAFMHHA